MLSFFVFMTRSLLRSKHMPTVTTSLCPLWRQTCVIPLSIYEERRFCKLESADIEQQCTNMLAVSVRYVYRAHHTQVILCLHIHIYKVPIIVLGSSRNSLTYVLVWCSICMHMYTWPVEMSIQLFCWLRSLAYCLLPTPCHAMSPGFVPCYVHV